MSTRPTGLRPTLLLAALAALVVACSAASPSTAPAGGSARPEQTVPPVATVPPTTAPITGEAPAGTVEAARTDLATRVGADAAASAAVVRSEAVTWPDGSLGCPVPGEMYVQVETPGYRIVLDVAGTEYDYRASDAGFVRLCETGRPTS